jgi:hypothetical protein
MPRHLRIIRYDTDTTGWHGYIEPRDRRWIYFVDRDGKIAKFDRRESQTGAVPLEHPRF